MLSTPGRSSSRRARPIRRAFTLIELLIAIALTLILVFAIGEFYAYVGTSVKDGRAMIDLVAQQRTASTQLKSDLDRLTLVPYPPMEDGKSPGYFEYFEGFGKDWDTNGNGFLDATEDTDTNTVADFLQNNYSNMLGDIDDVLAFTIRSDNEPLVGYGFAVNLNTGIPDFTMPATYSSSRAEVVWFSSFVDLDGDNVWDPSQPVTPGAVWTPEPRVLHRRQLIVNEALNVIHSGDNDLVFVDANGNTQRIPYFMRIQNSPTAILDGLQMYDVALRVTLTPTSATPVVVNGYQYFFAKSFFDLTRRENRFAHLFGPTNFSTRIDLNAHLMQRDTTVPLTDSINYGSLARWVQQGVRKGDDAIMSNVLSFDVRVFDPTAPIRADGDTSGNPPTTDDAIGVVQPGDPGWDAAVAANLSNTNHCPVVGFGAFVDLFYNRYRGGAPAEASFFSDQPRYPGPAAGLAPYLLAIGATYDTWAKIYEHDGFAQLGMPARMDLASNGLDDTEIIGGTYVGGIDDVSERETSPPYPFPLRGIQIKLRVGEPSTRQVRQATIGFDFIAD